MGWDLRCLYRSVTARSSSPGQRPRFETKIKSVLGVSTRTDVATCEDGVSVEIEEKEVVLSSCMHVQPWYKIVSWRIPAYQGAILPSNIDLRETMTFHHRLKSRPSILQSHRIVCNTHCVLVIVSFTESQAASRSSSKIWLSSQKLESIPKTGPVTTNAEQTARVKSR